MNRKIITLFYDDLNAHGVDKMKYYGPIYLEASDFKYSSMALREFTVAEIVRYIHTDDDGRILGCYILKDRYVDHGCPMFFTKRD